MEQTNPSAGVSQEAPIHDPSIQNRMEAFFGQSSDQGQGVEREDEEPSGQPQEAQTAEQPEDQAADELSPEDLDQGQQPPEQSAVEFEIVHNGQQVKLSREDTIKFAQQGFDYTRKMQVLAEKDRGISQQLQRLAQVEQVHPQVQQLNASVAALGYQLHQAEQHAAQVAESDPMAYPAASVRVDQIRRALQEEAARRDRAQEWANEQLAAAKAERARLEYARIHELVPEWADPQKRTNSELQVAKHYAETYGVSPQELAASMNGSGLALAVVYKAMKYDQLVKAKGEKVKQLRQAPPVTKPAATQSGSAKADKDVQLRQSLKKSGNREDAVAVLLNRMK